MRPLIGITLDWVAEGSFAKRPHYALRESYFDAVYACGGLPVALPLIGPAQDEYLARVAGVIIPGGDYPSPGWWYGKDDAQEQHHPRAEADVALIRKLIAMDKPVLGICAGHQTMAVATGGQLVWRVKDAVNGAMNHRDVPAEQTAHEIDVVPDSLLARLAGQTRYRVNSVHNEAVLNVGPDVRVVAMAPDGVIEALEVPGRRFALGVQWHPEFWTLKNWGDDHPDQKLFAGFMAAAVA